MTAYLSTRAIGAMHPRLAATFAKFQILMNEAGIDFIVTATFRSRQDQAALFEQGRTKPGHIVTNARPGQSAHNVMVADRPAAAAFDICILKHGKPDWDAANPDWKKAGAIGVKCGLHWGGNWIHFKEFPHFELPDWESIK